MTVTTGATLLVSIAELHKAVKAVLPHAETPRLGDDIAPLARVRIIATKDELLLVATNGRTAGMAAVEILEDSRTERFADDDGEFKADAHPKIVRDLRAGLTPQKVSGDLVGEAQIVITGPTGEGQPGTVSVQDVGGFWIGALTQRPLLPLAADYPDVVGVLRDALRLASGTFKPLVSEGPDVSAFNEAAIAYERALQVEPVGTADQRGWLILCGPRFAGSLMGKHDDVDRARRENWRREHLVRFGLAEREPEPELAF